MTAIETVESASTNLETQTRLGIVYELYNDINDLVYIGSTQGLIAIRLKTHKSNSKRLTNTSKIYTAMREIGEEHFFIRQLEIVEFDDETDLVKREFVVMGTRNKEFLYNMNTEYGVMSAETREKMSASQIGRIVSAETRAKLSVANKGKSKDYIVSAETRAKLSVANKGHIVSAETRAKLAVANKGKIVSDETRAKLAVASSLRTHNNVTKEKISVAKQRGGSFRINDDRNRIEYTYRKDRKQVSKTFSYGPRSHITKDQAMTLAKAYQRETFPDLFPVNDDE